MFEEELANPELEKEIETPTESPTEEKTNEEGEGSQPDKIVEENIPYHKDPRWIKMYESSKEAKQRADELEEKYAELSEWKAKQESSTTAVTIPDWFKRLYGEDEEVYKAYQESTRSERDSWKQEFREELKKEETEKQESLKKGEEWIQDQLADLRDSGITFDENELVKIVVENELFDKDGNPNFKAGLKFMETKEAPMNPNRKIAAMTKGGGSDPEDKKFSTSEDVRNQSFNDLIEE